MNRGLPVSSVRVFLGAGNASLLCQHLPLDLRKRLVQPVTERNADRRVAVVHGGPPQLLHRLIDEIKAMDRLHLLLPGELEDRRAVHLDLGSDPERGEGPLNTADTVHQLAEVDDLERELVPIGAPGRKLPARDPCVADDHLHLLGDWGPETTPIESNFERPNERDRDHRAPLILVISSTFRYIPNQRAAATTSTVAIVIANAGFFPYSQQRNTITPITAAMTAIVVATGQRLGEYQR